LNSIRTNRVARMVIVAMTFIGWFVLSNHCALGRMAQAKKEHTCCQNDAPRPAKEPVDGKRGVECCKSLHAVMPDGVKAADLTPPMFVVAVLASLLVPEVETEGAAVVAGETGPPRGASFSELVLHRSLRAHAPPFPA
jgi:hypothetical protein